MQALLLVILANIIWGAGSPIFKFSLEGVPPFVLAFLRFFIASFIFLPFLIKHFKNIRRGDWKHIFIGAFFGVFLNVLFFFIGLELSPSINANIIGSSGPLILYYLSLKILHEKPHEEMIKGILVSFLGIVIIIFAPLIASFSLQPADLKPFLGNLAFFVATLSGVFSTIENKKIIKRVNPYFMTGTQFLIGSIFFIPFFLSDLRNWSFSDLDFHGGVGIVYGIFFSSALAYFLLNFALKKLTAQETGIFSYVAPIAAILVAYPLLGEAPDIFFIVGSFFVALGIFIAERHPSVKKHKKKHF